jgi:hypothetical protein
MKDETQLLREVIKASGLSDRRFAVEVLLRDERTIRRWLAGDSPIPEPVVAFLKKTLAG